MTELQQKVTFDAAHRLFGYEGSCNQLHGHSWEIILTLDPMKEDLDSCGMVLDYRRIKEYFKEKWDHRTILNSDDSLVNVLEDYGLLVTKMDHMNPTAENIAKQIVKDISAIANLSRESADFVEVVVKESEDNHAKEYL